MAGERIQFTGVRPYPGFDQEEMKRRWNENDNGFDYNDDYRPSARSTSYPQTSRRPLINYVKNEWRTNPKYGQVYSYSPPPDRDCPDTLHMLLSIITAPKFRRYVLVYILLLSIGFGSWKAVSPRLKEHEILTESLNENMKLAKGGWFGTNVRAVFTDMIHMKTLDKDYLPGDKKPKHGKETRLIVVGDVHGCKEELVALLDKVSFDRETDHLILAGDMISKGPESQNVVDLARKLGASCVRGSHEDRILLVRPDAMRVSSNAEGDSDDLEEENFSHGDYADRALARKLTDKQYDWLKSCPVILRVGEVKGMGKLVVVHAGLVPGVELEKQDPAGVMNMRTIDLNTHVPSKEHEGVPWTKVSLSILSRDSFDPLLSVSISFPDLGLCQVRLRAPFPVAFFPFLTLPAIFFFGFSLLRLTFGQIRHVTT